MILGKLLAALLREWHIVRHANTVARVFNTGGESLDIYFKPVSGRVERYPFGAALIYGAKMEKQNDGWQGPL